MDANIELAYVYWKDGDMWFGYLQAYPDYMTKGESAEELQNIPVDIYNGLISSDIPYARKVAGLEVA